MLCQAVTHCGSVPFLSRRRRPNRMPDGERHGLVEAYLPRRRWPRYAGFDFAATDSAISAASSS